MTPSPMETEVLRILNGEDVPGWRWGAAMAECCSALKGGGYATGTYTITPKGKDYLAALDAPHPLIQQDQNHDR